MLIRKASFKISDSTLWKRQVNSVSFSEVSLICSCLSFCKGEEQPPSTLKLVQIYLDTATFDEIERDEKVKFTAALGLVGGTMGLLTGFSIISGIEVVFFLVKLISPFVVNFVKQKMDNLKRRFVPSWLLCDYCCCVLVISLCFFVLQILMSFWKR